MENTLSEKAQLLDALRAGDSARGDPLQNRPSLLAENGQCHPKYRTDPRPDMPGRNPLPPGIRLPIPSNQRPSAPTTFICPMQTRSS